MRILTAGESHGTGNVAIIEGFPKGVTLKEDVVNQELRRRASGVGRGKRMDIEADRVEFLAGLRNTITLGSPIAVYVKNKDMHILPQARTDELAALTVARPGHADLAGVLKYHESDIRNILERASARETVARVCIGSICKQFLSVFNIRIASFTVSVAGIISHKKPKDVVDIITKTKASQLNCIDSVAEGRMRKEIESCAGRGDTAGGVIEVWAQGLCPGVGSVMHFDKRLDGRLALGLMSIPAVKGVENGLGFAASSRYGSQVHDPISYSAGRGFFRTTNNAGGIEGGMSTGEPIILRLAMKPIATLREPLDSVDVRTGRKAKAPAVRSDTCAIAACGVIAESMVAITITESFLEKFGCDTLDEIKANYKSFLKSIFRKG